MGEMCHHAIVVTSFDYEKLNAARSKAIEVGLNVTPIAPGQVNSYVSFLVVPDGSKKGWEIAEAATDFRAEFVEWLHAQRYEDDSTPFDWVEVAYGDSQTHTPAILEDSDEHYRKTHQGSI